MTSIATPAMDDVRPPDCAWMPDPERQRGFTLALAAAGLIHLILILTVSFRPPEQAPIPELAMDVIILSKHGQATTAQAPKATPPARREPTSAAQPTTAPRQAEPQPAPVQDRQRTETAPHPPARTPPVQARQDRAVAERRQPLVDAGSILASRNLEVARLTADLDEQAGVYSARPRRKSVSASTREYRYASYLSAWARKVERIGNLNYPRAAKEQNLYGSLILDVAVRADGSVEQIRLVRSSGSKLLDEAAIQIVELAAPYSPFPPDIAAETDVLNIVRTWQFLRGGGLGWER